MQLDTESKIKAYRYALSKTTDITPFICNNLLSWLRDFDWEYYLTKPGRMHILELFPEILEYKPSYVEDVETGWWPMSTGGLLIRKEILTKIIDSLELRPNTNK